MSTTTILGRKLESAHLTARNTLSERELVAKLMQVKGATFATMVTFTEVKVTDSAFKEHIFKRSAVNVTLNHNYVNSVNNQRGRERV